MSTSATRARTPEWRLRIGGPRAVLVAADEVAEQWSRHAEEHDRAASFSLDNIAMAWDAGLANLTVPQDRGGVGSDLTTASMAVRRLGAGDPSSALLLAMHLLAIQAATIPGSDWSAAARDALLRSSLTGPGAGQPPAGGARARHTGAWRRARDARRAGAHRLADHRPKAVLHRQLRAAMARGLGRDECRRAGARTRRLVPRRR